MINGKTELLGIFGCPVGHSKSPAMHNALFDALGINAAYVPLPATPENLKQAMDGFWAFKFRGANVTIPFKEQIGKFATSLSPISKFTGSVNTLYWKDGIVGDTLCATTTDPYGALKNLEEEGISVSGKNVSVLGNGGAAAAIAFALLEKNAHVQIVCRKPERGLALVQKLETAFAANHIMPRISYVTFENFLADSADIILNATPVGMEPHIDETPLPHAAFFKHQTVYDIIYTPAETRLLREAKACGAHVLNGEGMLVYQGLASFKLWFPKETAGIPDNQLVQVMQNALKKDSLIQRRPFGKEFI